MFVAAAIDICAPAVVVKLEDDDVYQAVLELFLYAVATTLYFVPGAKPVSEPVIEVEVLELTCELGDVATTRTGVLAPLVLVVQAPVKELTAIVPVL